MHSLKSAQLHSVAGNHQTKADERSASARIRSTANSRSDVVLYIVEGAPAHNPESIFCKILKIVIRGERIWLVWAARPFPDIATHVLEAVRALWARNTADRNWTGSRKIRPVFPGLISPGIYSGFRTTCSFFPLGLVRQGQMPTNVQKPSEFRRSLV